MKKVTFEQPVIELVRLQNCDILCTSTDVQNGSGQGGDNSGVFNP